MVAKKDKKLIPELRFPGFDSQYSEKKVKDIAPLQRGFDLPVAQIEDGEYPVVFSNGALKKHSHFKAKAPGVVTGRSGTIGNVHFIEKDYWPHNTALWVTDFCSNDPKFIYFFYINLKLKQFGTGSGVPTLNRNDVHDQRRAIPSLPEQQKIASFLTAVDNKISKLTRKKELLEQYKRGVMQKIFSQEIRFPGYKDEWKYKSIGSFINLLTGFPFKSKEISEEQTGYPILRGINITEGFIRHNDKIDRFYTGDVKKYNKYKVEKNDLVLGMDGSKVGKNSALVTKNDEGSLLIQRVARIRSNNKSDINFIYQHINSNYFHRYVDVVNTSSGIPHISAKQINEFKIKFPSLEEQQKTASFLSDIDKKIVSIESQLSQTQTFKKGLLQKLFV